MGGGREAGIKSGEKEIMSWESEVERSWLEVYLFQKNPEEEGSLFDRITFIKEVSQM